MKKRINLEVYTESFPENIAYPVEAKEKIFIPSWGEDFVHYYFLVDFENRKITTYEVNLKEHLQDFRHTISAMYNDQYAPYNMSVDQLLFWITCPHQGEYYNQNIIVSMNYCNCFININTIKAEAYLITDPESKPNDVYSSTNELWDGKMYTSRWDFSAIYKTDPLKEFSIPVQILSYDINTDIFTLIDTIEGHDQIHSTSISKDGRNIVLVEQNATPVESKILIKEASEDELSRILKSGLIPSKCWVYNIDKKKYTSMDIPGSPAHVSFDNNNNDIMYFSQHQLAVNQGMLYSFASANILKIKFNSDENTLAPMAVFNNKETLRLPGHVVFDYKGKELIIAPSTPNQIILINRKDMSLYQNFKLSNNITPPDLTKKPYLHSPMSLDKTPYSVHAKSDLPYLYLSNASSVGIYDIEQKQRLINFRHVGDKMVLGGGHSSRFSKMDISDY